MIEIYVRAEKHKQGEVDMKKLTVIFVFVLLATAVLSVAVVQAAPSDKACWGQATKVFAQTGEMGEHASGYDTPRYGLRNLARELYADGTISDNTMQALGAFVAEALGLEIDACM
jgi:hypothetical protein